MAIFEIMRHNIKLTGKRTVFTARGNWLQSLSIYCEGFFQVTVNKFLKSIKKNYSLVSNLLVIPAKHVLMKL